MGNNNIYKQILREYEKDRDIAKRVAQRRKNEIYQKIPRICDIDKEIAEIGIKISKAVLNKNVNKDELIKQLKTKSENLINEKEELLKDNGFKRDYLQAVFKCELCQDTGYIENKQCKCFKQKLINEAYNMYNLKDVLEQENFDSFNINYYSKDDYKDEGVSPRKNMEVNLSICLEFVNDFGKEFKNLLLYGDSGLGKTFLCNCIARELLNDGKIVIYVTAFQLFKMIEKDRFSREENYYANEIIEMIEYVDLLIIDDLGTELSTIISSSELFNFINSRLISKKPTIISTNLSPNELMNQYSYRTVSRFLGNYTILEFFGDDIRKLKKENGSD